MHLRGAPPLSALLSARLELSAAAEAGVAPGRAFERQMIVLGRLGDAEIEADDVEERHGGQRHSLPAVIVRDMKEGDIAAPPQCFPHPTPPHPSLPIPQTPSP